MELNQRINLKEIPMNKEELKKIIKEAIKEVVEERRIENFLESVPLVLKWEMEEINKLYGKPAKKEESTYSEEMEI